MNSIFNKLFKRKQKAGGHSEIIDSGNIKAVVLSDLGNVRTNNEDIGMFYRIADEDITREKGYLLMVADGMGGHNAGEVASSLAVETISKEYFKQNGSNGNIEKNLSRAFAAANKKIFELSSRSKAYHGMGTTCTAFVIAGDSVYYAHAGDSRGYFFKNNAIQRVTEDHTYVQELVNKGEISSTEADTHPKRNILTNAMGTRPEIRIDTGKCEWSFELNDKLLLCSDGLYDYITEPELTEILNNRPIHDAAGYMIEETKKRGGHDNITVVLAEKIVDPSTLPVKETRDFDLPQTKEYDLP